MRIANYEHRLLADTATMRPIYLERLLDDYRAKIIRHDRIDRELAELKVPGKSDKHLKKKQRIRKLHRENVKY